MVININYVILIIFRRRFRGILSIMHLSIAHFKKKGRKRLNDMLGKARRKGTRPSWIGDDAWVELQTYWKKTEFLAVSSQNKTNRASARGGAVHTTGRKAHIDVALQLVSNKILTNYYYYEDSLYLDSFTRILY